MIRVVLADDQPLVRDGLRGILEADPDIEVVGEAADGLEAIEKARARPQDLIVLDIMLPELDGFQVVRTLRAESHVPILVLSARGEEFDRVLGLELGADDYLTKPFAMRELLARVRSLIRRAQMPAHRQDGSATTVAGRGMAETAVAPARLERSGPLVAGDLVIDVARRHATLCGTVLSLKPKEFDLLAYLARHPGIVLSRDALLREVWGYEFPVDTRTVDVHVRWLRQKVEDDPAQPRRIETVRGYGYRFVSDPA